MSGASAQSAIVPVLLTNPSDITVTAATPTAVASVNSAGVSVGATSTTVLAANAKRLAADIVNDSNEVVYLKKGEGAESNKGIRLNANGGSYSIGTNNLYKGIITGICASGSKVVTVEENVSA